MVSTHLCYQRNSLTLERFNQMTLDIPTTTDDILTSDTHLIQSFADLNALNQNDARTVIVGAEGAYVTDSDGNKLIDGIGGLW